MHRFHRSETKLQTRGGREAARCEIEAARASAGVALRDVPLEELEKRCKGHKLGTNANGWKNPYPADDPRALYLEYQFAGAYDASRFKISLIAPEREGFHERGRAGGGLFQAADGVDGCGAVRTAGAGFA